MASTIADASKVFDAATFTLIRQGHGMPAVQVFIDDHHLVTVSTSGLDMVGVSIAGTVIGPHIGEVWVTGGTYPEPGASTHLIWIENHPIQCSQRVTITLEQDGVTNLRGRTIEEAYRDSGTSAPDSAETPAEMFQYLREQPRLFDRIILGFDSNVLESMTASMLAEEYGYGMQVIWAAAHRDPAFARIGLSVHTLAALEHKDELRTLVRGKIGFGDKVELTLDQADG